MKKTILIVVILTLLLMSVDAKRFSVDSVKVPLTFDDYYSYEMVVSAMKKLHKAFPNLTKLDHIGKSEEGRSIYCMIINNPQTGKALDKPGIYVDGNIHGNEIQAGEVNLYLMNYLLVNYDKIPEIKKLVDKKCFYIIPIINPDGRYHFFKDANTPDSNRGLRIPKDDDHDGLVDEDFPDDLDGDGNICMMRKRDPDGNYKTDPNDPRLMIRTKPGEKGEWLILGREGIDNDGDGKVNEDSEGYVDPNRNWGYDWAPNYVQSGAGDYPLSGTGIKSIADYISRKKNICISWMFHNAGGMILRGPSTKSQGEYPRGDIKVYDYLGKQAERITPGYRYMISWKDLYSTYGDYGEFMAAINGTYNFVGELYISKKESFKSIKESSDAEKAGKNRRSMFRNSNEFERERLKFDDNLNQGALFKEWKHFKHPLYGDIEIGGWIKMSSRLPAPFMLKELVHRNASSVIFSAKNTPEVSMKIENVKRVGENLIQLRVKLSNSKAIPTMSFMAREKKIYPEDMLTVKGKGIKVVSGGLLIDKFKNTVKYKEYRPELQFFSIPGFSSVRYQFLISGKGNVSVKYYSRHGGKIRKVLKIK